MNNFAIRVLVLDDDPFILKLFKRMLDNLGYTSITTCDNGHDALRLFDGPDTTPDLILLDINMPGMDGLEFLRHLVDRHYVGGLILVSGEDERMLQAAEKLAKAHHFNVLGHLHKPVPPDVLGEMIALWSPQTVKSTRAAGKTYTADELRAAIQNGELVNYYQPKVEVATGYVKGMEALVRWRHPQDGMVFPDRFISIAEENGLIDDLTRAVLKGALTEVKRWQEAGLMLHVAVNLSMDSLVSLDFLDTVVGLVNEAEVSTQLIELEVTETRLMEDLRVPLEVLSRLRLKRFRLSIDDFGIGNSTLAQLRDLPFDELKIDQSFVHKAHNTEKLRVLFDSSLSLAKELGMTVVAEGVEDREDWDFVLDARCDIAQGYFIAKPMPASEIGAWIQSWKKAYAALNEQRQHG